MMNNYLQGFAYRIEIKLWVFGATTILGLFIAFISVVFQSIKAAKANPVKSLRSE